MHLCNNIDKAMSLITMNHPPQALTITGQYLYNFTAFKRLCCEPRQQKARGKGHPVHCMAYIRTFMDYGQFRNAKKPNCISSD